MIDALIKTILRWFILAVLAAGGLWWLAPDEVRAVISPDLL